MSTESGIIPFPQVSKSTLNCMVICHLMRASSDQLDPTKNVNYNEELIEDVISRPTP